MPFIGVSLVQNADRLKPVAIPTKSDERGLAVKLACYATVKKDNEVSPLTTFQIGV
ncbi:hypothetical protein AsFPU1_0819 [Aphanothece sacrum FPU1]|uniref:Uncharacterized protein n=1 Tax=Aphanothece sacrum FPU1 TaxID=1920663 RepID=A0A401IDX5_APHSA|nr:hypothetical protein AsFPU1_0819 [Aphanothece sacrum FPU1]GBF86639.1 hypothetical protein AsFPU3_3711 [Aphanothece sacrum FPU3]